MKLLERLKADLQAARVAKDPTKLGLLSTLIGEVQRNKDKDESDKFVVKTIQKFIESTNLMIGVGMSDDIKITRLYDEVAILESYLPKELSEAEIVALAADYKADGLNVTVPGWMKFLSQYEETYSVLINKSVAALVFKQVG